MLLIDPTKVAPPPCTQRLFFALKRSAVYGISAALADKGTKKNANIFGLHYKIVKNDYYTLHGTAGRGQTIGSEMPLIF